MRIPRLDGLPPSPPHAHLMKSPVDLLRKMHWDLKELREALKPTREVFGFKRVLYKAFDLAVTGWHLLDWSYREFDERDRDYLYGELAGAVQPLSSFPAGARQREFFNAVHNQYPILKVCHDLANGGKHGGYLSRPQGLNVSVEVRHQWIGEAERLHTLHIFNGGVEIDGVVFFKNVLRTWEDILSGWGVIEDVTMGRLTALEAGEDD